MSSSRRSLALLTLLVALLVAAPAHAGFLPPTALSGQDRNAIFVSLAANTQGEASAVWADTSATSFSGNTVRARTRRADGSLTDIQRLSAIDAAGSAVDTVTLADGSVVAAWTEGGAIA